MDKQKSKSNNFLPGLKQQNRRYNQSLLNLQHHPINPLLMRHHLWKLFETQLASCPIRLLYRLNRDLAQNLRVDELARHHFQQLLDVCHRDLPVAVDVVELERELKLGLSGAVGAEEPERLDEGLEIASAGFVTEEVDYSVAQRVCGELGDEVELFFGDVPAFAAVEVAESVV